MSFSRPNQWYHSHVDPIWLDGAFNIFSIMYMEIPSTYVYFVSILRTMETQLISEKLLRDN
jgi:hypothetical protein